MRNDWQETGRRILFASAFLGSLTGCAHRDAVDTVGNWWHQYEGGAIAQQRPPPPGAHNPYPHVGLTPTTSPEMPSPAARTNLTDQLEAQRNFGNRLAAADGPLPVASTIAPSRSSSAKPRTPSADSDSGSSMTVDAPGQTTDNTSTTATSGASSTTPSPARHTQATADQHAPELAMPAVTQFAPPPIKPGELPQIGSLPPAAPQFPGFDIPRDAALPDRPAPAYALADPHGRLFRFGQSSDQLAPGQEQDIGHALDGRGPHAPVYVTGFGDATSLAIIDQAASLRLGLLRARTLADALIAQGVDGTDIRIAASAIGHGARISLRP